MSVSELKERLDEWKAKFDKDHAKRLAKWSGSFLAEVREITFPNGQKGPVCRLGWKAQTAGEWVGNMVQVHPRAVLGEAPGFNEFEPLEKAAEWLLSDMENDCAIIEGNEERMAGIRADLAKLAKAADAETRRKAQAFEAQARALELQKALPDGFKGTCFVTDDAEGKPQSIARIATEDESRKVDVPLSVLMGKKGIAAEKVRANLP